jgi:hypothetical protein
VSGIVSVAQQGIASVSCSATNTAALTGASKAITVQLDSAAPELAPSFTPATTPILLGAVASAAPNATDPLLGGFASGIAASSCAPVDTASAGLKSTSCTAADVAGNTTQASASYVVGYGSPILRPHPGKRVRSPGAVSVVFVLTDANGAPISSSIASQLGCTVTASFDVSPPTCAKYAPRRHQFTARVEVPAGVTKGNHPLTVMVTAGATTLATTTVSLKVVG